LRIFLRRVQERELDQIALKGGVHFDVVPTVSTLKGGSRMSGKADEIEGRIKGAVGDLTDNQDHIRKDVVNGIAARSRFH
jgi:hypothetical protein